MAIPDVELSITRTAGGAVTASLHVELPNRRAVLAKNEPIALNDEALRALLLIPDAYAGALNGMVFVPTLREAWQRALGFAEGMGERLRVRLHLQDEDALHTIRWELLRDPVTNTPLAYRERVAFSRYLSSDHLGDVQAATKPQLRALVAVSRAAGPGMAAVDVAGEVERAVSALGSVPTTVLDGREGRPAASLPALAAALRDQPQLLVLTCHGALIDGQPYVYLERLPGEPAQPIPGADFVRQIADLPRRPLLVVLASCQGAGDNYQTLAAIGPQLARIGVGAVLAMQGNVPMALVAALMPRLFEELGRDGQIDRALAAARAALPVDLPWWMPTLWMTVRDGALWYLKSEAATPIRTFADFLPPETALPPYYLGRPAVLDAVRVALIGADSKSPGLAVLHGMGGSGKSVLTRALCDDKGVRDLFPDGVLWATLGRSPDLVRVLRAWVEHLGGFIREQVPTPAGLGAELGNLLRERRCLLVLDDVWNPAHARALLAGGQGCGVLLNSRDAEVAHHLGAPCFPVGQLDDLQAVLLLERWAEGKLDLVTPKDKAELVEAVGRLPLALRLAGRQLMHFAPDLWLKEFRAHRITLRETRFASDSHGDLNATLALSIEALPSDDVRQRYFQLAIFKEDTPIPLAAVTRLWEGAGGSTVTSEPPLRDFGFRALLDYNEETQSATIHDLLRDLQSERLGTRGMKDAHEALLAAYRPASGRWADTPDDGYVYDHLAYHLSCAERWNELHDLFMDDRWLQVRVLQSDWRYDGYIADLLVAWEQGREAADLARCLRYALIRSSINTLAANYESALLAEAVRAGLPEWPLQRVASIARHTADPGQRANLSTLLLAIGDAEEETTSLAASRAELRQLALVAVEQIGDEQRCSIALANLASHLAGYPDLLTRALNVANTFEVGSYRRRALVALAPHVVGHADLLAMARAIEEPLSRSEVIGVLTAQHPESQQELILAEALEAVQSIDMEDERYQGLLALAPHLAHHPRLLAEALKVGLRLSSPLSRSWVVIALAPNLAGHRHLLTEALQDAQSLERITDRSTAVAALAPHLPEAVRGAALADLLQVLRDSNTEEFMWDWSRANALCALAPQLAHDTLLFGEALLVVEQIDSLFRQEPLAALTPLTVGNPAAQAQILNAALAITFGAKRSLALTALAPYLPEAERRFTLDQALQAARSDTSAEERCTALAALVPLLLPAKRSTVLAEALASVPMIAEEWERCQVLCALALQLTADDTLLTDALLAAQTITSAEKRSKVLCALAPSLRGNRTLLLAALRDAQAIDEQHRTEALVALAVHLTAQPELFAEVMAVAQSFSPLEACFTVLTTLVPLIPSDERPSLLVEMTAIGRAFDQPGARGRSLAALAPLLPEDERPAIIAEVIATVEEIADPGARSSVLADLTPLLPSAEQQPLLAQALDGVRSINDESMRSHALVLLTPYLREHSGLLTRAIQIAQQIRSDQALVRTRALIAIGALSAGHHSLSLAVQAAGRKTDNGQSQHLILAAIPPQSHHVLSQAVQIAQWIIDKQARGEVLAALAPQLVIYPDLFAASWQAALGLADRQVRRALLSSLASHATATANRPDPAALLQAIRLSDTAEVQGDACIAAAPLFQGKPHLIAEIAELAQTLPVGIPRCQILGVLMTLLPEAQRGDVYHQWQSDLLEVLGPARVAHSELADVLSQLTELSSHVPLCFIPSTSRVVALAILSVGWQWHWR